MRTRILLATLLFSILLLVIATLFERSRETAVIFATYSSNTPQYFDLKPEEMKRLSALAEKNNGEAAYKLCLYYTFTKDDMAEGEKWCKRSADLGYKPAQDAYVKIYVPYDKNGATNAAGTRGPL